MNPSFVEVCSLYELFLEKLAYLKQEKSEFEDPIIDFQDLKKKLGGIVKTILFSAYNIPTDHDSIVLIQFQLNVLRMFCEIVLLIKHKQDVRPFRELLLEIFPDPPKIFQSLLSIQTNSRSLQFSLAEALAFLLFVLHFLMSELQLFPYLRADLLRNVKNNVSVFLDLRVIEQMCIVSSKHSCNQFENFLLSEGGILCDETWINLLKDGSVESKILVLRIYGHTMKMESSVGARVVLLKNIALFLQQWENVKENSITHDLYWDFLACVIPFPGEHEDIEKAILKTSSESFLVGFLNADFSGPVLSRCFGGYEKSEDMGQCSTTLRTVFNLTLTCLCLLLMSNDEILDAGLFRDVLSHWKNLVRSKVLKEEWGAGHPEKTAEDLIHFFIEEDDELIDFLVLQIQLHSLLCKWMPSEANRILNPNLLFLALVQSMSFDSSIFLDWLVSNETRFLLYFVKILKFVTSSWIDFVLACSQMDAAKGTAANTQSMSSERRTLEMCVDTLAKLRNLISRLHESNLFPYSPKPLLRHLGTIKLLYDGEQQ